MSILDENPSNFNRSLPRYRFYSNIIYRYLPDSAVLTLTCVDIPCCKCIGSKYNIKNGCPVCGEMFFNAVEDGVYICLSCGSAVVSCGGGDTSAVGINSTIPVKTADDII